MNADGTTGVNAVPPVDDAPETDVGKRDGREKHHAFIAYHRPSSGRAALALQRRLEDVAHRNEADPPLDVFRDKTGLRMGDLYENLRRELVRSEWLIVVLHRRTRESWWVGREVTDWLAAGGTPARLVLVNIDPELRLTWQRGNPSAESTNDSSGDLSDDYPLPPALRGVFPAEPVILNLPWRRLRGLVDRENDIVRLCGTLLGWNDPGAPLNVELDLQRQRARQFAGGLAVMSVLAVLAVVASVIATRSRDEARRRESDAVAQAAAAEALLVAPERPERSVDLLIDAATESPSRAVRSAIFAVLAGNSRLTGILDEPDAFDGQAPDDVVFSPSGRRLAGWRELPDGAGTAYALWDVETKTVIAQGTADLTIDLQVDFLGEDRLVFCGAEGVETLRLTGTDASRHELVIEGTGTCLVTPMQGGALGVAADEGVEADAALLDGGGAATILDGVRLAAANRYDDVALVHSEDGLQAWATDGHHVALDPPGDPLGDVDLLSVGGRGRFILRADGGRVLEADAFAAEPQARPVRGIPDGALAVSSLGDGDHVWVTADDRLQWSRGPESIPVGDLRGEAPNVSEIEPAIWASQAEPIVVVAFGRGATVVRLATTSVMGSTSMARVDDVTIDADTAERPYLMDPFERGAGGVLLPRDDTSSVLIAGADRVHPFEGLGFFDPTGAVAVGFGDAPLRLFPDIGDEPEELSSASDVTAVALSPNGSRLAAVRPTSAVTIYSTRTSGGAASLSLVETDAERWQATAAFGTRRFRANNGGQFLVAEAHGSRTASIDRFIGTLKGIHAVRPDGLAAVVAQSQRFSVDPTDDLHLVNEDGGTNALPEICQPTGALLRFLPGHRFREDVAAAELQQLTLLASSDDPDGSGSRLPFACPVDGRDGEAADVAAPDEILDYQVDESRGRIVARREDGQIDVTTWRRGEQDSLTTDVVPGTGPSSSVGLSASGDLAALTNPGSGAISLLERAGGTWRPVLEVRSTVPDVTALIPDDREQLLTVIGAGGTVEVFGLDGGQQLVHADAPLDLPDGRADAVVRWSSVEATGDAYTIHLAVGSPRGPVQTGARVSIPLDVDVLRAHLCDIHPAAAPCGRDDRRQPGSRG